MGKDMSTSKSIIEDDVKTLHTLGYSQELSRRMRGFSNFAISFSIICILAGGITSFQIGFSSTGGFGIGVGWLVGGIFALIVSVSMAQIASAYPTAGGLYHWSSILGGRGWGWATAWVNMLGLIFVVAAVSVGAYTLIKSLVITGVFGIDTAAWGVKEQIIGMTLIAICNGLFNHFGIKLTTKLTDFSGYLIFAVAGVLTIVMLACAPSLDFSRLFTFVNTTGDAGGGVFPHIDNAWLAFGLGLLLPLYTITGFDASAHTSEETVDARKSVPRGMINSVFWSITFGYVMVCSFVLAMGNPVVAAKDGGNVFFNLMAGLPISVIFKDVLYIGIAIANYLCALACVTSTSRMIFAFSRDGGMPRIFRKVSPKWRTPTNAIWLTVALSVLVTLYSSAYAALSAGCAVFLYVSYAMPIAAGFFAEGKSWTTFGPFKLGVFSKPLALITVFGVVVLTYLGIQPPNDIVTNYAIGIVVLLVGGWFLIERKRFAGPPMGAEIANRQQALLAEEAAVGEVVFNPAE
jgi:amino acid transporter